MFHFPLEVREEGVMQKILTKLSWEKGKDLCYRGVGSRSTVWLAEMKMAEQQVSSQLL